MNGDRDRNGRQRGDPAVPVPLRDRVEELFVSTRGYEPASFQEALGVVCDLAEAGLDAEASRSTTYSSDRRRDGPAPDRAAEPLADDTDDVRNASATDDVSTATDDEAGPPATDGLSTPADSVDDGPSPPAVDEPHFSSTTGGDLQPTTEEDLSAATVESLLQTEHADAVVRELAAEVVDEMTDDAFDELEHGVDEGTGAGVADGMGIARDAGGSIEPSGDDGGGVPDSLTADPESDCAICGDSYRVSVLETTILAEDGSVSLVCPGCSDE